MKRASFIFLLLFLQQIIIAQNARLDSLTNLINNADSDTGRIKLLLSKVYMLSSINLDSSINLALRTLNETRRVNYYRGEVDLRVRLIYNYSYKGNYKAADEQMDFLTHFINASYDSTDFALLFGSLGLFYGMQSKYDSSIYFYEKAIRIYERTKSLTLLSSCYSNNAIGYQQLSNFPMALVYFQKALKISEERKDEHQQAYTNLNIGNTYINMSDSVRGEKAFLKAVELANKHNLKAVELYAYTNLSSMFTNQMKFQKAYDFAIKAADLGRSMGDKGIEAASFSKAAGAMAKLNQPGKALALSERAISAADSSGQPFNIWQAYGSKGFVLMLQEKWKEAIPYYENAISILKDADTYTMDYGQMYNELSECYEKTGNYSKALTAFKKYALIADSIRRKDNIQKATELTMNYEFDKREQAMQAEQKAKDAITQGQQLALITGLILSFIIIAGASIGYRNKKRANALLQIQKKEIENQKNYLTSSINYAKQIQSAVFPSDNVLASYFTEQFILFKPLDVVSGDFYWYKQNSNEVYIAVADCTGHGVPGAFMSILGITYLNEIVNKTESGNPDEILYQLRENVMRSLNQSNQSSDVKDGMEVAFCKFNMESRVLQFSGAFRPLFLIRDNAIHHLKGDKMPIGVYDNSDEPFTNNNIQLQKDDLVYIFTDGYVDQIGGPERKTFKTNRFKDLLLDISGNPFHEQKYLLERKISEWQGGLDQTDDILVVGFKITA